MALRRAVVIAACVIISVTGAPTGKIIRYRKITKTPPPTRPTATYAYPAQIWDPRISAAVVIAVIFSSGVCSSAFHELRSFFERKRGVNERIKRINGLKELAQSFSKEGKEAQPTVKT